MSAAPRFMRDGEYFPDCDCLYCKTTRDRFSPKKRKRDDSGFRVTSRKVIEFPKSFSVMGGTFSAVGGTAKEGR